MYLNEPQGEWVEKQRRAALVSMNARKIAGAEPQSCPNDLGASCPDTLFIGSLWSEVVIFAVLICPDQSPWLEGVRDVEIGLRPVNVNQCTGSMLAKVGRLFEYGLLLSFLRT